MLLPPKKNRNKKGLLLSADTANPAAKADTLASTAKQHGPVQVAGSSRSSRHPRSNTASHSVAFDTATSPLRSLSFIDDTDSTLNQAPFIRSSYHNTLSEQLATLELGVEFKLDLRSEDLQVLNEIGSGNGGTVSKCLHLPTKAIMAKKVRLKLTTFKRCCQGERVFWTRLRDIWE